MKTIEMQDDVWQELQHRAMDDVILRGLLKLMQDRTSTSAPGRAVSHRQNRGGSDKTLSENLERTGISPRELGKQVRHRYATKRGMRPLGSIVYDRNGVEAIMPFATERNPDHWFLGAPVTLFRKGKKQFLVLLCWKDETVLDFVIPPEEVADLTNQLTFNLNKQFMFNVAKRCATRYELLVPGRPRDITNYLHADKLLNGK